MPIVMHERVAPAGYSLAMPHSVSFGVFNDEDVWQEYFLQCFRGRRATWKQVRVDMIRRACHERTGKHEGPPPRRVIPLRWPTTPSCRMEVQELVVRALAVLTPCERQVILEHYWHGHQLTKLATMLHISLAAVFARHRSALCRMRAAIVC